MKTTSEKQLRALMESMDQLEMAVDPFAKILGPAFSNGLMPKLDLPDGRSGYDLTALFESVIKSAPNGSRAAAAVVACAYNTIRMASGEFDDNPLRMALHKTEDYSGN